MPLYYLGPRLPPKLLGFPISLESLTEHEQNIEIQRRSFLRRVGKKKALRVEKKLKEKFQEEDTKYYRSYFLGCPVYYFARGSEHHFFLMYSYPSRELEKLQKKAFA